MENPRIQLDYFDSDLVREKDVGTGKEWVTGTVYALEVLKTAGLLLESIDDNELIYRRIGRYEISRTMSGSLGFTNVSRLLGPKNSVAAPVYRIIKTNDDGSVVIDAANTVEQNPETEDRKLYSDWWFGNSTQTVTII